MSELENYIEKTGPQIDLNLDPKLIDSGVVEIEDHNHFNEIQRLLAEEHRGKDDHNCDVENIQIVDPNQASVQQVEGHIHTITHHTPEPKENTNIIDLSFKPLVQAVMNGINSIFDRDDVGRTDIKSLPIDLKKHEHHFVHNHSSQSQENESNNDDKKIIQFPDQKEVMKNAA